MTSDSITDVLPVADAYANELRANNRRWAEVRLVADALSLPPQHRRVAIVRWGIILSDGTRERETGYRIYHADGSYVDGWRL